MELILKDIKIVNKFVGAHRKFCVPYPQIAN